MTDTPTASPETTDAAQAASVDDQLDPDAQEAHCRHCGQPSDTPQVPGADWLCGACERYQDAVTCPTCGQLARISLLPEGTAPEPHAPARRRRTKE